MQNIYEMACQEVQRNAAHVVFTYDPGFLNISSLDWQTAEQFLQDESSISLEKRRLVYDKVKDGRNVCVIHDKKRSGETSEATICSKEKFIAKWSTRAG